MFAVTENLLLRPGWAEDAEAVAAAIADKGIVRNLASAPWPYGIDDAREHLARMAAASLPVMLVTTRADARIVGILGFDRMADGSIDMGYWIARSHWGKGYATEAGRAGLEIMRTLGHRRIEAGHFIDNPASGRVLRKLGFVPTGDTVMRTSCGRDEEVEVVMYALDLTAQDRDQVAAA
ncbi:GNAT family N-acetyltransferase [Sphingomicrobium sp. XHP0239]|uniref:GNAT family N-acetyltransferase n=1 Tax=Sphingomicrobium maritimum TaxID=3133972 RepID=UPI0031CC3CE0